MSYITLLVILFISFIFFGGIGKVAMSYLEASRISKSFAQLILNVSMFLWYLAALICITLIAFKIVFWLGWIIGVSGLLWLIFSAIPSLSRDTQHSIELAESRRNNVAES